MVVSDTAFAQVLLTSHHPTSEEIDTANNVYSNTAPAVQLIYPYPEAPVDRAHQAPCWGLFRWFGTFSFSVNQPPSINMYAQGSSTIITFMNGKLWSSGQCNIIWCLIDYTYLFRTFQAPRYSLVGPLSIPFHISSWPNFSEGGFFKARLTFPKEYPLLPPKMKFITAMWHPNSAQL